MKIQGINPDLGPQKLEKQKPDAKKVRSEIAPSDKVELSKEALELQATGGKETVESSPPLAQPNNAAELLLAVQRKIEEGEYDRPEVQRQIAEEIIKSPALSDLISSTKIKDVQGEIRPETIREDRVRDARKRIQEGYYNQNDVVRQTANRIMDTLLGG